MATIVNEFDALLRDAAVRDEDPRAGKYMLLTADTSVFKVTFSGGSPEFITITALPVNIPEGTVTWNIVGGTLTGSGNERELYYDDMTADQATISTSITYNGEVYPASIVISKIAEGGRGPGQFFAVGSIWADSVANTATPGDNLEGDIVTIFNNTTFAETRKWSGSAWVLLGRVTSGSDIITDTITAAQLKNGILDATKFASSIEPITMVESVPPTKSTSNIFNTADGKLYRWNGTEYIRTTPTDDLSGQIVAGQIATDAVIAGKIAAGAITAREIQAGAITTDKLVVQSRGMVINDDPYFEDFTNAWTLVGSGTIFGVGTVVTGAATSRYVSNSSGGSNARVVATRASQIDPTKTYSLYANFYTAGSNNRQMLVFIDFFDKDGVQLLSTGWGDASRSGFVYGGIPTANIWSRNGGQFGAGTVRAIPATARTCKIGVILQSSLSGSTNVEQAAQDIRLEKVNDGTLIQDGVITTQKIAAQAITAAKLQVGTFDNILPDPKFVDLTWWGRPTALVNDYSGAPGFWKQNKSLFIDSHVVRGAYQDTYTEFFPSTPGAFYLVEYQVFVSADFVGRIGLYLHLPSQAWFTMGGPLRGYNFTETGLPVNFDSGSAKGTQQYSAVFQLADTGHSSRMQIRVSSQCTAGYFEFGSINITRVSNGVLIADGAVTAGKINVGNLQAVSANIGLLRTASSGARTEITDNVIRVYDASNVLRVKIGNLA